MTTTDSGLPDGIALDLVRWRCDRCAKTHTWVPTGSHPDPLAAAVASAWQHHADHEQWSAERLATTTRERTDHA